MREAGHPSPRNATLGRRKMQWPRGLCSGCRKSSRKATFCAACARFAASCQVKTSQVDPLCGCRLVVGLACAARVLLSTVGFPSAKRLIGFVAVDQIELSVGQLRCTAVSPRGPCHFHKHRMAQTALLFLLLKMRRPRGSPPAGFPVIKHKDGIPCGWR